MKPKVLIVDDDVNIRCSLEELFSHKGYDVCTAEDGTSALERFNDCNQSSPDVVLLDVRLPDIDGLQLLQRFKNSNPDIVVVIITAYGSVPQSVEAMHFGAADYVLKPFNVDEIVIRVQRALENRSLKEQVGYLSEKVYGDWDGKYVVGSHPAIRKIYDNLELIAQSNTSTIYIDGETGTGKEVIARRIHALSPRKAKPFVDVNATALTSELLESELFGHEAGSFTGATKTKKGLFEVADGGTLFLDEIGDMGLAMQAKLLRALQERKIRRVGGTVAIDVDIRLITATNRNLEACVKEGKFREDLYYRLHVVPIHLPPLRERSEDIEMFVHHFVHLFNVEFGRNITEVEPAAMRLMKEYAWPGNVRELRNFIERTMLLECSGNVLKAEHVKFVNISYERLSTSSSGAMGDSLIGTTVPLEVIERQHIEGVLRATSGNKNQAAQILGIDRTTLYNKIKKYQII